MASPAQADPVSFCNATITDCTIYEGSLLEPVPGAPVFIAGDWVFTDAAGNVSDVLRFYNNIFDAGGGTGLGDSAFLFSMDEGNLPGTLSVNARFLPEAPPDANGVSLTTFVSNGTTYHVNSPTVPEPATFVLLAGGLVALSGLRRRRPTI